MGTKDGHSHSKGWGGVGEKPPDHRRKSGRDPLGGGWWGGCYLGWRVHKGRKKEMLGEGTALCSEVSTLSKQWLMGSAGTPRGAQGGEEPFLS